MTATRMMMDIACLLFVGARLIRISFGPLRKIGFQAVQRLGKRFAFRQSRGMICSSNSAIRSKIPGSLSPSLALGAVAELVGIEGGVVSGVINLESSGVEASDWRPRHDEHYHEV